MSYTRRCAEAPIGRIHEAAKVHPDWNASVLDTGELCLSYNDEHGHYIFGFIDVHQQPHFVTTSVSCYACPSDEADVALRNLIRSAK